MAAWASVNARGLTAVVGVALIVAGCGGGGSRPPSPADAAIHLDGKPAHGDFVTETDGSGARFLVPAATAARSGNPQFDVAAPTSATTGTANSNTPTPRPYRAVSGSANATMSHAARVEILATGEPGRRFVLGWTDTCWPTHDGHGVGNVAGHGLERLRSPAVTLVKLPQINAGAAACYLAASASTTTFTRRLRLTIIDH